MKFNDYSQLAAKGLLTLALCSMPLLAQTDPNTRPGGETATSSNTYSGNTNRNDNWGWLGLLGLAGLAGLIPRRQQAKHETVSSGYGTASR